MTFSSCHLVGNTAYHLGGAVSVNDGAVVLFKSTDVRENAAVTLTGGAFHVENFALVSFVRSAVGSSPLLSSRRPFLSAFVLFFRPDSFFPFHHHLTAAGATWSAIMPGGILHPLLEEPFMLRTPRWFPFWVASSPGTVPIWAVESMWALVPA